MSTNYKFDNSISHMIDELKFKTRSKDGSEVIRKALALLAAASDSVNNHNGKIIIKEGDNEREVLIW